MSRLSLARVLAGLLGLAVSGDAWALDIPEDDLHVPDLPGLLWSELSPDVHLLGLEDIDSAVLLVRYPMAEAEARRTALFVAENDGVPIYGELRGPVAGEVGPYRGRAWRGSTRVDGVDMEHEVVQIDRGGGRGLLLATSLSSAATPAQRAALRSVREGVRGLGAARPATPASGPDHARVGGSVVSVPLLDGWRVDSSTADSVLLVNAQHPSVLNFLELESDPPDVALDQMVQVFEAGHTAVHRFPRTSQEFGDFPGRMQVLEGISDGERERYVLLHVDTGTERDVAAVWRVPVGDSPKNEAAGEAGAAVLARLARVGSAAASAPADASMVAIADGRVRFRVPSAYRVEREETGVAIVRKSPALRIGLHSEQAASAPSSALLDSVVMAVSKGIEEAAPGVRWMPIREAELEFGAMKLRLGAVEVEDREYVVVLAVVGVDATGDFVRVQAIVPGGDEALFDEVTEIVASIEVATSPDPVGWPPAETPSLRELLGR